MHLSKLKDNELLAKTKSLAEQERKVQVELLHHLLEVDDRKLYLRLGFGSLFDYVVKELNYSESAAYRRIQAMRLLRSVPEVDKKILKGDVNLTSMAQVQSFVKAETKKGLIVSVEQKAELIEAVENKSTREVEKYLLSLKPEGILPEEKVRVISAEHTEIKIVIDEEFKQTLDQLKDLLSHVNPEMTYTDLYKYLAKKALKQLDKTTASTKSKVLRTPHGKIENPVSDDGDKKRNATPAPEVFGKNAEVSSSSVAGANFTANSSYNAISISDSTSTSTSAPKPKSKPNSNPNSLTEINAKSSWNNGTRACMKNNKRSRFIPRSIQREVWRRDGGCCTYTDPETQRRCGSRFQVQIDHIHLFSRGGKHERQNLRLLCARHNRARTSLAPRT